MQASSQLASWLQSKGAKDVKAIPVETDDGDCVLVALDNIQKGDSVLTIPRDLCLTVEVAQDCPVSGQFLRTLNPWLAVGLFMIRERAAGEASPWAPYLATLPEETDAPVFWSNAELKHLEGTQLAFQVQNYLDYIQGEYTTLADGLFANNPDIFPADVFTIENLIWAFGILRSRTPPVCPWDKLALVPGIDSAVYASDCSAMVEEKKGFLSQTADLTLVADRPYVKDEVINISYGPDTTSSTLALEYGIPAPLNASQVFQLTVEVPETDRFYDDKLDVLELQGMATEETFYLTKGESPPDGFMAFMRLIGLDGPDAFHLEPLFREEAWTHLSSPISRPNEENLVNSMIAGAQAALDALKDTRASDVEALKNPACPRRRLIAARVREGEREILMEALGWFEERKAKLDNLVYYAERRLQNLGLLDENMESTFTDDTFNARF